MTEAQSILTAVLCSLTLLSTAPAQAGGMPDPSLGQHYSPLALINPDNVGQLVPAWIHQSGDLASNPEAMSNSAGQSTPLLLPEAAGESLVYCTPFNRVIALDPGTGAVRWEFDPQINRDNSRPFRCRGVSYWATPDNHQDKTCRQRIFTLTADRRLIALDALDGKPCPGFGRNGEVALAEHGRYKPDEVASSSPPAVANGVVVVGSSIIDFALAKAPRGIVAAFDAISGEPRWQFDPLEGIANTGGANVWAPIAIDAARDLVFLPTSAPSPDYYGVLRPGSNGNANAVVALQLSTGKHVWSFQHSHHDLWDFDTPAQPILFDWPGTNGTIPALVQLTKQGLVFVLDRRNGKPLLGIEERPVPSSTIPGETTSPTQPFPLKPPPLMPVSLRPEDAWGLTFWDRQKCHDKIAALNNQGLFTPPSEQATLMFPGSLGGANWGGGAYLPAKQLLMVNVNAVPFTGQLIRNVEASGTRDHPTAGQTMHVRMQGTPYTVAIGALMSPLGIPCSSPPWGRLVAVDLARGEIAWSVALGSVHEMGPVSAPFRINWGTPNLGGGLATASGILFIGATMDRLFRAFDAGDGRELWSYQLPVDATATPMTYVYRGRQYVLVNAGGHVMFNRAAGDYLYAFALPE
ncbi:pyrroloquinoline quinone-dependent dehydrogenase [Pseudomonas sp. N040]|uniref:pyrroloquinoline quinone-dependent dehydrogenase n=1 Tax=Pseudomonas sp. N040 TaxID=2785325 RepID=UPI0018A2F710|nr:pyrroloquinoline quinone-dependent dehydrogenase [Pseudomonas sp. N040]MBF7730439.1 pyrroloquinoline quinone-dependent dehydrogenase [Pseudomonas sp. N040]MBW7014082.1 pyrroloquinoline quinone-dependent dehydrogenase [Pseudomonas sp. N040]